MNYWPYKSMRVIAVIVAIMLTSALPACGSVNPAIFEKPTELAVEAAVRPAIQATVNANPSSAVAWEISADAVEQLVLPVFTGDEIQVADLEAALQKVNATEGVSDEVLMAIQTALNWGLSRIETDKAAAAIDPGVRILVEAALESYVSTVRSTLSRMDIPLGSSSMPDVPPPTYGILYDYRPVHLWQSVSKPKGL